MGGVLGAMYYRFVKFIHYEEANPGQDHDGQLENKGLPDGATLPRDI